MRPTQRKCCGGALTVLSATTVSPADAELYEPVGDPCLGVWYRRPGGTGPEPDELLIELRGRLRPRLNAYWDGCAFKI